MTTENNGVSASDSAESIAASVSAAAATIPAIGESLAPVVERATGITLTDLETALNSRQGTQNNWNAQQMRTIEANLSAKLDATLAPLMARQKAEEQARIEELDPEDQVAYWKQQATAPAPQPSPAAPQQVTRSGDSYSAEDRLDIINATTNMLSSEGVNVPYTDDRLWAGATNGMSSRSTLRNCSAKCTKVESIYVYASCRSTRSYPASIHTDSTVFVLYLLR
jgi:hypothetical protein